MCYTVKNDYMNAMLFFRRVLQTVVYLNHLDLTMFPPSNLTKGDNKRYTLYKYFTYIYSHIHTYVQLYELTR